MLWQGELVKMLVEMGQSHLFQHWPEPGVDDDQKIAFVDQVNLLVSLFLFVYSDARGLQFESL